MSATLTTGARAALIACTQGQFVGTPQMINTLSARGLIDIGGGRGWFVTAAGYDALGGAGMHDKYKTGICGCGAVGIVVEMTDRLWFEFFSVVGYAKPETVAGCDMCRTDWEAFAAPITPVMQATA